MCDAQSEQPPEVWLALAAVTAQRLLSRASAMVRMRTVRAIGTPQILLRCKSLRPMTIFWISDVPSPMSSSGASRYRRSISYSLE